MSSVVTVQDEDGEWVLAYDEDHDEEQDDALMDELIADFDGGDSTTMESLLLEDCGTGAGGFKQGNTCGEESGGGDRIAGLMKKRREDLTDSEKNEILKAWAQRQSGQTPAATTTTPKAEPKSEVKPAPTAKLTPKPAEAVATRTVTTKTGSVEFGKNLRVTGLDNDTKSRLRSITGKDHPPEVLASLGSAPSGSTVKFEARGDSVNISISNKEHGVEALRKLYRNEAGELILSNEEIKISRTGTGLGTVLFKQQIDQAAAIGVKRIETVAAGNKGGKYNGYYTWPRLGYDGDLEPGHIQQLERGGLKNARKYKKLSQLLKTDAGKRAWEQHGSGIRVSFDPKEGSKNRKVLDEYLARKRAG